LRSANVGSVTPACPYDLGDAEQKRRVDARKLAELLRAGLLSPVYHGESSARTLQQLIRSYTSLTE
jgi:hypothetical protein